MSDQLLAVTSSSVWLPSSSSASPATLIVSLSTGSILSIVPRKLARADLPEPVQEYLDVGDQWILPGVSYLLSICFFLLLLSSSPCEVLILVPESCDV